MTINTSAGKINASKAVLNKLAIFAGLGAEAHRAKGLFALATEADEIAEQIHEALADTGYYEF